jgi:hypothetical protein
MSRAFLSRWIRKARLSLVRCALWLGAPVLALATVPRFVCGADADALFDGDRALQVALANGVVEERKLRRAGDVYYHTGYARFDGQSAVAIDQMTILGLSQIVLLHPELRAEYLPTIRAAAAHLVDPRTLSYAARVYGQHGVVAMAPGAGHAYLGYINLALGMLRAVDPDTPLRALHDRLSEQLAARLFGSPTGLIETYPGETWPPDVAAVAGSLGLHAKLTGVDRSAQLLAWAKRFADCAVSRDGYLVQRVQSGSCVALDAPRGSGTAVAAYFLSFADRDLARRLHQALAGPGARTFLGFSAIREYGEGFEGQGDVNAGPIVLGVSVGATGFGLGSAAANRDRALFRSLYRTLDLFGAPVDRAGRRSFAVGGSIGNALLLAMLSARPT